MLRPIQTDSPRLIEDLESAWQRSDRIFGLIRPDAWLQRPIPLRHPFLFYLGHLPAFARNLHHGGRVLPSSPDREFDSLYAFGIDPADEAAAAREARLDWPSVEATTAYRDRVRDELRKAWTDQPDTRTFRMILEHELMHHETLLYLVQALDPAKLHDANAALELGSVREPRTAIAIPEGQARLGVDLEDVEFAWDNELPSRLVEVDSFRIDQVPVSVEEYRAFVDAGGYQDASLWNDANWDWKCRLGHTHPKTWSQRDGRWWHRHLTGFVPLDDVGGWPVQVSHAEASAFARWAGGRLPTEAELHRAAYGTPTGESQAYPWGDESPKQQHGNFDFQQTAPLPVGSRPAGRSAFGVDELLGNGWEWTDTEWRAHEGFETWHEAYPGYSSDFFDLGHKVLFGGSWATDRSLLRRSFRNWFQPRYRFAFSTFRLAYSN